MLDQSAIFQKLIVGVYINHSSFYRVL